MRATVTYADVSGISQIVQLNQDRARPVVIGAWTKLVNPIGNRPPGYYGSDNLPNLTVFVYHNDGTMQEVSPTLCLGESDHDWDYRRLGFLPQKPVDEIRLQFTILGTEPTTSLWIDDVSVYELGDNAAAPFPSSTDAPKRTLLCQWGGVDAPSGIRVSAGNNSDNLNLVIPERPNTQEINVYFNINAAGEFVNHYRYLYDVIKIKDQNSCEIGKVTEKQGYIACGLFSDANQAGIDLRKVGKVYFLTVPFRAFKLETAPDYPIGFNIEWKTAKGSEFWSGRRHQHITTWETISRSCAADRDPFASIWESLRI